MSLKFKLLSVPLFLVFLLTGCHSMKTQTESVDLSGNYTVKRINGNLPKVSGLKFSLGAQDQSVHGFAGCNSFFGKYHIDQTSMEFDNMASTEKYCEEEFVMDTEFELLNAINETGSFRMERGILTLYSKDNLQVLLEAEKEILK